MAKNQRTYEQQCKVRAVKLVQEKGSATAERELGKSRNTLYTWVKNVLDGRLDIGGGVHKPSEALTRDEELI